MTGDLSSITFWEIGKFWDNLELERKIAIARRTRPNVPLGAWQIDNYAPLWTNWRYCQRRSREKLDPLLRIEIMRERTRRRRSALLVREVKP